MYDEEPDLDDTLLGKLTHAKGVRIFGPKVCHTSSSSEWEVKSLEVGQS